MTDKKQRNKKEECKTFDSLGVPIESPEQNRVCVGYDWMNRPIFSDDNDEYIYLEGEYILDEPDEIRAYLLQHAVIVDTMQIYEEVKNG